MHCFEAVTRDVQLPTRFLTDIESEEQQWLLQAAPWVEEEYNSAFLIVYLDRLASANPTVVGKIYLTMLSRCAPSFDPEHIRSIVTKLYKPGLRSVADEICNAYGQRGMLDLVRDIYEAHRQD